MRFILDLIARGWRWDKNEGRVMFRKEWELEDNQLNLMDDERVGRILLDVMNQVCSDLSFTMEVESQFDSKAIPTLDFSLWMETPVMGPTRLSYSFYSKPMASKYVELEISARAWTSKCASLTQEVFKRLQNTSEHLPKEEKEKALGELASKLKRSGYNRKQTREIMEAGIKGYHSKLSRGQVNRPALVIQDNREIRKVLEKSTWYLPRVRGDEQQEGRAATGATRRPGWRGPGRRPGVRPLTTNQSVRRNPFAPVAPMFVPRTQGGTLITVMRGIEERLASLGPKMMPRKKMVEKGGQMLRDLLTSSDP